MIADTLANAQILLAGISEDPEEYGIDFADLSSLELGAQIPTYVAEDGELKDADSYLYPLYSDGRLIAFITSFYVDEILESMISSDLTDEISALADIEDAICE